MRALHPMPWQRLGLGLLLPLVLLLFVGLEQPMDLGLGTVRLLTGGSE